MTHHVESTAYPTTDENGNIKESWLMNQIKSSNDMHPFSPMANFIMGGFNNHIAHHLFPHIHHIHYPRLSRILYKVLNRHGIVPNQTSYMGGIVSHLKLLKKMSVLCLFLFLISCRKPDKVLIKKDGEWTMYIREVDDVKITYDTLLVDFTSLTNGTYKRAGSTDTFTNFTWSYYVARDFFDYGKRININLNEYLSETTYKITDCKRNYEKWECMDGEFLWGHDIHSYIDLKRN